MERYSIDRFADVIRHTGFSDGVARTISPGQDGAITVNIAGLTAQEQGLARAALHEWQAITNLRFVETAGAAQITYANTGSGGAHTTTTYSGGSILRAAVEISSSRVAPGDGIGSYAFRTYMHETAHALGLGHPQDYSTVRTFEQGAILNDSWQMSLLSYFSQTENTAVEATKAYNLTPMVADYVAIRAGYGATAVRAGDTIYGVGSTAGGALDRVAQLGAQGAFLIADTGGRDTLSFAGFADQQNIDLRPGAISNVMGGIGNMQIAPDTVIENATGGRGSDVIIGNGAANLLNGGGGVDRLVGGAGHDTYVVDGGDTVVEAAGGGIDTVRSSTDHGLAAQVENLVLTGSAVRATGNALANVLTGTAGTNVLDGGGGADRMIGGAGNDSYIWRPGATVVEAAGGGIDTVHALADHRLAAQVENLVLAGPALRGWGNELANRITGNAGSNMLDGGAGADTLVGGLGNDDYVVTRGDVVIDSGGLDTMHGRDHMTLAAGIENGWLGGGYAVGITGNALGNRLSGNTAANVLVGLDGADTLNGLGGRDTLIGGAMGDLYLTDGGDVLVEAAGGGYDTVLSTGGIVLADNIEQLVLKGTAQWAVGNAGNNVLHGNDAANALNGAAGNDMLWGGGGADRFIFDAGVDRVMDFADNVDEIALRGARLHIANLAQALAAGTDTAEGVWFAFGNDRLLVAHTTMAALRDDLVIV